MVKKIYVLCALTLLSTAPAVAMQSTDVATLSVQLNHINTQMNAIKRAWNEQRIKIKMAEKAASSLYNAIKPVLERLINSSDSTTNMDTIVSQQFDEIVNKNSSFKNIKTDNNLSDLFPNLKMSDYGAKLYKAMANKAFYVLLGQKLADKVKEITAQIKGTQSAPAGEQVGQSVM